MYHYFCSTWRLLRLYIKDSTTKIYILFAHSLLIYILLCTNTRHFVIRLITILLLCRVQLTNKLFSEFHYKKHDTIVFFIHYGQWSHCSDTEIFNFFHECPLRTNLCKRSNVIINEKAKRRLIWTAVWCARRKHGLMMKTAVEGDPTGKEPLKGPHLHRGRLSK